MHFRSIGPVRFQIHYGLDRSFRALDSCVKTAPINGSERLIDVRFLSRFVPGSPGEPDLRDVVYRVGTA